VTSTLTVQLPAAATLPPESETVAPPAVAPAVPPAHVVLAFGIVATTTPLGSESVSARLVSAEAPLAVFAIVSVNVETPLAKIGVGLNALVSVTFAALTTASVALAGCEFVPPCVVVSAPAGIVFG
jgi:hypothetical protein